MTVSVTWFSANLVDIMRLAATCFSAKHYRHPAVIITSLLSVSLLIF